MPIAKNNRTTPSPARPTRPPHARSADLRFGITPNLVGRLTAAIQFLPASERVLLEQLCIQGLPAAKVAALTGETVRKVRRRAKELAERALANEFEHVAMHSQRWSAEMKSLGEAVFIRGMSARAAARLLGIPYRAALLHASTIRALPKTTDTIPARKRGAA